MQPLHLHLLVTHDNPDRVASLRGTGFDETDSVEHNHRCPRLRHPVCKSPSHARVEDALQLAQLVRVTQHSVAQPAAVDRPVLSAQQMLAEPLGNGACLGRTRRVQTVHQAIRVDVVGPVSVFEQPTNRALAARDIARESKQKGYSCCQTAPLREVLTRASVIHSPVYTVTRAMHLKPTTDNTIVLKSPREIAIMREAGKIVVATIRAVEERAQPGVTTRDLDQVAAAVFKAAGAESTELGYFGYPAYICVSVNDEVVHGIPGPRKLKRGDLVKVDVAARYNGYVADSTHCFAVGGLDSLTPRARDLVQVTQAALFQGIAQARPGNRLSDIGAAIEEHVRANGNGMAVVRNFVGHGVGRNMHEAPQVQHHGPGGRGPILRSGMCLAIEPQVNLGSPAVRMLDDGWTAVTLDGSLSAHFEHTVAITDDGPEILTLREDDDGQLANEG